MLENYFFGDIVRLMNTWRLVQTPPLRGEQNMALDEAILESVVRAEYLPTLRLYAWSPPCLSLGYAQPSRDVDLSRLHSFSWSLVRRPTGGRAILHTDELTYSISAPLDHPLVSGSILESYSRLSQALLATLELIGLPARADQKYLPPPGSTPSDPVCFEVPSNYEIVVAGKKIIGSAQARRNGGVLQHGSLPLTGDISRINQVLVYSNEEQRNQASNRLMQRATTVESILGKSISWNQAAQAMIQAFSTTFSIQFITDEISQEEWERANQLVTDKYGTDEWNFRS